MKTGDLVDATLPQMLTQPFDQYIASIAATQDVCGKSVYDKNTHTLNFTISGDAACMVNVY